MRWQSMFLTLLLGGACLSDAGARVRERASAPVAAMRIEPEPVVAPPAPAPFAVDVVGMAPRGVRVPPSEPVVVRFDHVVDRGAVERSFGVEPPVAGSFAWPDARTLAFAPGRWEAGHDYRVRIGGTAPDGGTVVGTSWSFRTGVPAPARIEPGGGANVVFTFDDGPRYPAQATQLLDLLSELGIRALFFPSGRWTAAHPGFVARALRDGHRVCNHTWSHVNLSEPWMTDARIQGEIARGANDGACRLFRPPLMGVSARVTRVAGELGYGVFLWNIDSRDWEGGPALDIENLVLGQVRPGAVVLFHMHATATLEALPSLAARLREAGYVLSWDPADAGPGAMKNGAPVSVEQGWVVAGTLLQGAPPADAGPPGPELLDSP